MWRHLGIYSTKLLIRRIHVPEKKALLSSHNNWGEYDLFEASSELIVVGIIAMFVSNRNCHCQRLHVNAPATAQNSWGDVSACTYLSILCMMILKVIFPDRSSWTTNHEMRDSQCRPLPLGFKILFLFLSFQYFLQREIAKDVSPISGNRSWISPLWIREIFFLVKYSAEYLIFNNVKPEKWREMFE